MTYAMVMSITLPIVWLSKMQISTPEDMTVRISLGLGFRIALGFHDYDLTSTDLHISILSII